VLRAIALVVSGCHSVFGLTELTPPVDAVPVPDLPAPDAPSCLAIRDLPAPTVDDTMLLHEMDLNCNPSIRYGDDSIINIGQPVANAPRSRVLIRFDVSVAIRSALDDGVAIGGLLTLALRPNDCPCINQPTTFQIFAASEDWNDGTGAVYSGAGWCNRRQTNSGDGIGWQMNGADGPLDRGSIPITTRDVTAGELGLPWSIEIPFALDAGTRTELRSRIANDHISLILIATSGGPLYLRAIDQNPSASILTIRECR
jgi:hypothetical protein